MATGEDKSQGLGVEEPTLFDSPEQLAVDQVGHTGQFPEGHPFRENPPKNEDGTDRFASTNLGEALDDQLIVTPDTLAPLTESETDADALDDTAQIQPVAEIFTSSDKKPNKTKRLLLAAGVAVGAVVLAATTLMGGGSGKNVDAAQTPTTTDEETPTTSGSPSQDDETTSPDQEEQLPMYDLGNGFSSPDTRPERDDTPPEIIETNDTDKALDQLAAVMEYVMNTGDESYLNFLAVLPTSELADRVRQDMNNAVVVREQYGISDFFYWVNIKKDAGAPSTLSPDGAATTVPIKYTESGFGGASDNGLFDQIEAFPATLVPKDVTFKGKTITIQVFREIGEPTFSEFYDWSSIFDGGDSEQ